MKVRKARGRRVAGGKRIGRTLGFDKAGGAGGSKGFIGYAGVPKAGDEEGIGFIGVDAGCLWRKIGAVRNLVDGLRSLMMKL